MPEDDHNGAGQLQMVVHRRKYMAAFLLTSTNRQLYVCGTASLL
jgi:hypothetical protein